MNNIVALRQTTDVDQILAQPKNIEAELAIIGSALVNNTVLEQTPWLDPDDFFEPVHGRIWEAMQVSMSMGRRADPVSIKRLFDQDQSLAEMDGSRYLQRLAGAAESIITAVEYAREVKATSRLRELYRIGDEFRYRATDPALMTDAGSIIAEFRSHLDALCQDITRPMGKHVRQVLEQIQTEMANPVPMWSTGIPTLDHRLGGGVPADFVIGLEARMKGFKTGCAHTLLLALARQRIPSCYIALEMGSKRLAQRMLGQVGRFNSSLFRHPGETLNRFVSEARPLLECLPLWFIDAPSMRFSRLKAEASQMMQVNGCRVFVLDYWQLVCPDGKSSNKADFLGEVADWCASHAREHGTTWIILSQQNRSGESLSSDGLARACDFMAVVHKHEQRFSSPVLDNVETVWMDVKFSRDGEAENIGGPESPMLYISKHGPHLAEIGQPA